MTELEKLFDRVYFHELAISDAANQAQKILDESEKAYGGCHVCYGKGYSTVNGEWVGHDTDTDIGSRGGTVRGGKPIEMKYCVCARGKQLESLLGSV